MSRSTDASRREGGQAPPSEARAIARAVLTAESDAIRGLIDRLDDAFDEAVEAIATCPGRLVLTGMGKSGLILRKLAATFSSTGTPALFLHPAEAVHGDLGSVMPGDVVLCASSTGETEELTRLLPLIRDMSCRVIALCGRRESTLARAADLFLDAGVAAEACPLGLAPTASSTAALALGDALAMAVSRRKGFTEEDFGRMHPGGGLGRRFLRVRDLMHSGDDMPVVAPDDSLRRVIQEMTVKRLGMTCVVEGGRLAGVISDGDLRRLLEREDDPLDATARDVMSDRPRTVGADETAARALALMEAREPREVTFLVVVDARRTPLGVIQIHDLWRDRS